jgi:hypothetical protein
MTKDTFVVKSTHESYGRSKKPTFDAVQGCQKDFINLRIKPLTISAVFGIGNHTFAIPDVKRIIRGLTQLVKMQESR